MTLTMRQNLLEGAFKDRLLGSTPRVPDLVGRIGDRAFGSLTGPQAPREAAAAGGGTTLSEPLQ